MAAKDEKLAHVYLVPDQILYQAYSYWEEFGAWGATTAVSSLSADSRDEEVGLTLLEILTLSGRLPANVGGEKEKLYGFVGIQSDRAFVRLARLVVVSQVGRRVAVSAWPRDSGGGGWGAPSAEPLYVLEDPEPGELGARIRRAFMLLGEDAESATVDEEGFF